jgi:uncharacterized protein (UPF0276 family)
MVNSNSKTGTTLSRAVGIGLRPPHYTKILEDKPFIPWLEVHSENFLMAGGPSIDFIKTVRETYPLSLHGLSLSLGSADGMDMGHLSRLKKLIDSLDPCFISDHLAWNKIGDIYFHNLCPVPYTEESLDVFIKNIDIAQTVLKRRIAIENPASYLEYTVSTIPENEFLCEVAKRAGASLLLDINNLYISSYNHGWCAYTYLTSIPSHLVTEIHLAGHSTQMINNFPFKIDDHGNEVCRDVWELYKSAINHLGPKATLIEWDNNIPDLSVLLQEAQIAQEILSQETLLHDIAS